MFKPAERKRAKLRLGICGPSGSGKTYSALLLASGIGGKIAVVDTENSSAELYADLCAYDVCTIQAPYTIDKYLSALKEAETSGYSVVILDSITHAWAGEGGLLDQQGKIADASSSKNSYTAWRTVTPKHNAFIEAMLSNKCHIIATMRVKQEYVQDKNDKGKTIVVKVGLAPVQREGMEYEFTTVLDIDVNHNAKASKDRTRVFGDQIETITAETGKRLITWLETGKELEPKTEQTDIPEIKKISVSEIVKSITNLTDMNRVLSAQKYALSAGYDTKDLSIIQVAITSTIARLEAEKDLPFLTPPEGEVR
jgi:hypothetical protein